MATKIYMVRHGYSEANKLFYLAGQFDSDLDKKGKKQAEKIGEWFKDKEIHKLYSSDLTRAYKTAEEISKNTGMPIIRARELREINVGEWQGRPFAELEKNYPKEYGVWINDIGRVKCPGGESMTELSHRVFDFLKGICEKNDGKTICFVTHATPIRAICTHTEGLEFEDMKKVPYVDNASVSSFIYENGCFEKERVNITEHLAELYIKQQGNV